MAAVHPVEIADGEHAALEGIKARPVVARGDERLGRLGGHASAGRPGTETTASPSSTTVPSTIASQAIRTRWPLSTSSLTSTMTVTTSPILTGAWKFSDCDR